MGDTNLDFCKRLQKRASGNTDKKGPNLLSVISPSLGPHPLPPRANPRSSRTPSPTVDQLVCDARLLMHSVQNFNKRSCITPPDGLEVGKRSRNKSGEIAEIFKEKLESMRSVSPFPQGDSLKDPRESIFNPSASCS